MAVTFNNNLMGKMTIKQGENTFDIEIRQGNCLGVFIYRYVDENGQKMCGLYAFFADVDHIKNIIKHEGKMFFDEVIEISLNCRYKECLKMLPYIVKQHNVECYYE